MKSQKKETTETIRVLKKKVAEGRMAGLIVVVDTLHEYHPDWNVPFELDLILRELVTQREAAMATSSYVTPLDNALVTEQVSSGGVTLDAQLDSPKVFYLKLLGRMFQKRIRILSPKPRSSR